MYRRTKGLLRLAVLCALCMAALFVCASAAQTRTATLDLTEYEHSMIDRAEGWYWDYQTKTLTLMDAKIQPEREWIWKNGTIVEDKTINGIVLPADSTVVLLGESTVQAVCYGLYSEGEIHFEQKTLLAPQDLSQLTSEANGKLSITGETQAVKVGGIDNPSGTMLAGKNWYSAYETDTPGTAAYVQFEIAPRIVIDITDCGVQLEQDGFYLLQNGATSSKYPSGGVYVLTGTSNASSHSVQVADKAEISLTLENIQLDLSEMRWKCPLIIGTGAKVELILKGENVLRGGTTCAGIEVADGAVLTVSSESTGGLTASGGAGAAGIGGGSDAACGTVNIQGGTIAAAGSGGGAGIGQGSNGSGGSFVVSGGSMQLTGSYGGAALGGGARGSGGSVQVSGGTVTARGGSGAPGIGAGKDAENFVTSISGGTVAATGGKNASGIGAGTGASGCKTSISGGTVQSGGGRDAAGLSAGGTKTTVTTEDGIIPVQPEGGTETGAPNTMTITGGSISAAPGAGSGTATVDADVSGGSRVATIAAVKEPAFSMPDDKTAQTYESYLDSLLTEDDVRQEAAAAGEDGDKPDEPDESDDFTGMAVQTFDDLDASAWYIPALDFAAGKELIDAIDGKRTFAPSENATREVVVEALWRLIGRPEPENAVQFVDVASDAAYASAIAWANENGIVTGSGNGRFRPTDDITRQEMCAVLARFAAWRGDKLQVSLQGEFADADDISTWAREAVYLCRGSGLVAGRGNGMFYPRDPVTRAELAQMVYNLEQIHADQTNQAEQGVAE